MKLILVLSLAAAVFAAPSPQEAAAAAAVEAAAPAAEAAPTKTVRNYMIVPDADGDFELNFFASDVVQRAAAGKMVPGLIRFTFPNGTPFEMTYVANERGFRPLGNLKPERPTTRLDQIRRATLVDEIRDHLEVQFNPRLADNDDDNDSDLDDLHEVTHTITF